MRDGHASIDRRAVLRALGLLGLVAAVPACASTYSATRLTLATGGREGVYFALGNALADAWLEELGLDVHPEVLSTAGSVDNLRLLSTGAADVVFSQVDTAAEQLARTAPDDPRVPRALARIYDDVVHVVVPASSPVTTLAELRGARVSLGAPDSGVYVIATRLLEVVGLSPGTDLTDAQLGLTDSTDALATGDIDAFFWSGGLPTRGVLRLADVMPIRLLNLQDVITAVRGRYPVYASGTVPAASYGIPDPITTLLVRNFLLVGAGMADDLASALVAALFNAQEQLAAAGPAALTIDPRAAIGTQPVPLHPGAERFFRTEKNTY
jgi:TRAP transporter TAXI family solute receptor